MPNLYLPVVATIFSGLLLVIYFSKKRVDLLENKLYSIMLIVVFIDSILSSLLFYNVYTNYNQFFVEMCNKFDYLQLIIWVSCMYLYTYTITHKKDFNFIKKFKIHTLSIIIINIFIAFIIFLADIEIVLISSIKQTAQGDSVNIAYYTWGFYMLLCTLITIFNIKRINKKYIPIFVSLVLSIISYIIFSVNPYLIVISICLTFINLVMYFTIENPDLQMLTQMELAKEEAEKANKHKSDFLSSMSHEIRTPLNAIVGLSEINVESNNFNEMKENAKDIMYAANILLEIVGNVLDMSRIESGSVKIVNTNYNPYSVFNNIIKIIEYRYEDKNIKLNTNIAPDIPNTLYGDHASINKILLNLLTNAVKYTSEGHVDFVVNCVNKGDICRLIISVEDTGRGIKPEMIKNLFTKFNRIDEDKNTTNEGTGLGLAITKHVIELMGGTITVQSVYGSGSKFTVTLDQRIQRTEPSQSNYINSENKKDIKSSIELNNIEDISNKKILVIDDNKLNLKVATKLLSCYGVQVFCSESGQDCIDRINKGEEFDLLLADEMMPNMSGSEMMKKLRENGFKKPIIALTADVENNAKDEYLSNGYDDYLKKPIERTELDRVLKKYL